MIFNRKPDPKKEDMLAQIERVSMAIPKPRKLVIAEQELSLARGDRELARERVLALRQEAQAGNNFITDSKIMAGWDVYHAADKREQIAHAARKEHTKQYAAAVSEALSPLRRDGAAMLIDACAKLREAVAIHDGIANVLRRVGLDVLNAPPINIVNELEALARTIAEVRNA